MWQTQVKGWVMQMHGIVIQNQTLQNIHTWSQNGHGQTDPCTHQYIPRMIRICAWHSARWQNTKTTNGYAYVQPNKPAYYHLHTISTKIFLELFRYTQMKLLWCKLSLSGWERSKISGLHKHRSLSPNEQMQKEYV